jgi:Domain of unknown function (DUF4157)
MRASASQQWSDESEQARRDLGAVIRVGFPWWLSAVMRRGFVGITLGRRIYLHRSVFEREMAAVDAIVRHELQHVRQARALGLLRFLYRYVAEYARNRRRGLDHVRPHESSLMRGEMRCREVSRPNSRFRSIERSRSFCYLNAGVLS